MVRSAIMFPGAERCPSGRRSGPGKLVLVINGSWVRIPPAPPASWRPRSTVSITPSQQDRANHKAVMGRILEHVRQNRTIRLPAFDPKGTHPGASFALQNLGENDFAGGFGDFR